MQTRLSSRGIVFISVDYRLIPPSTGHDVIEDIKDAFAFVATRLNDELAQARSGVCVDAQALGVAGTSAGGLCAYLAAMHATPRPKAVVALYAMGGDFITPHYLTPKTKPFFRGREMLDPQDFEEFLHPFGNLPATSDSPLAYYSQTHHIPGYPANSRMLLGRLYLQMGKFVDYYTDLHEPDSLSVQLRPLVDQASETGPGRPGADVWQKARQLIPEKSLSLCPQFCVSRDWPPIYLAHGTEDSAVLIQESRNMYVLLKQADVDVTLLEVEGKEHSFDYVPDAEELLGAKFDEIANFLVKQLSRT
ncbi:alpha beta-hydrolase [Coniophora puteana RWD-64-598 SS2]|uniref:Alpha beta-hydrolase n=1 Tax=Coniophora puteana (strain RWD-64-598) TaxID=741705 RepID=A0A5M3MRN2_CONPW|nr:alpha beta-hydrolase [Coniophora puteana RWD-64-598 SS2]EIW81211.1 alpha beta-hydrolase [Coniophora puteana RWD-64-598 SS2]